MGVILKLSTGTKGKKSGWEMPTPGTQAGLFRRFLPYFISNLERVMKSERSDCIFLDIFIFCSKSKSIMRKM